MPVFRLNSEIFIFLCHYPVDFTGISKCNDNYSLGRKQMVSVSVSASEPWCTGIVWWKHETFFAKKPQQNIHQKTTTKKTHPKPQKIFRDVSVFPYLTVKGCVQASKGLKFRSSGFLLCETLIYNMSSSKQCIWFISWACYYAD